MEDRKNGKKRRDEVKQGNGGEEGEKRRDVSQRREEQRVGRRESDGDKREGEEGGGKQ